MDPLRSTRHLHNLREIGDEASVWKVSSAKGYGVENLRGGNGATF